MTAVVAIAAALLLLAPAVAAQDATLDRARQAIEGGRAGSVQGDLAAYVKANPRSAAGAFWMGRYWVAARDWQRAADWFEKAVVLDANDAHVPLLPRRLLRRAGGAGEHVTRAARALGSRVRPAANRHRRGCC